MLIRLRQTNSNHHHTILIMNIKYFCYPLLIALSLFMGSASGIGQSKQVADTMDVEPKLLPMYRGLFDAPWSKKFSELWNSNPDTAKLLGGMGTVYFVSMSAETVSVLMNFDTAGRATFIRAIKSLPNDTIPAFSSTLEKWAGFMEGKFHAIAGVLAGKIKYKGPMSIAFKYGWHFDKVAPVGKMASHFVDSNRKKKTN